MKLLGIKPAGYRLIVKPDDVEEYSSGGIALNLDKKLEEAAQTLGTLISVGDQAWKDMVDGTPWAKEGDRIMYARHAGKNIQDPSTEEWYKIINDKDLIAIVLNSSIEEDLDG